MKIHTKLHGETITEIADKYGVGEELIRKINEIKDGEAADGEELLILFPTRSYTVQYGDTVDRIALRFGVRKKDIYSYNPWLIDKELKVGQSVALKYDERRGGTSAANGYFYKGCDEKKLKTVMPFLTYITFAEGVADERGIRRTADFSSYVKQAKSEGKIPLIRVYDRYPGRYKSGKDMKGFAEEMIKLAQASGYKGIVLDSCPLHNSAEEFTSFLMILRKMMIGCDLILITEINENSPIQFSEYADGSVMYYPKLALDNAPTFNEGERRVLSNFACAGESAKTFIDLSAVARYKNEFLPIRDALNIARKSGQSIEKNKSTLLSHTSDKKQGEYIFASLESTRAILELAGEFDYMGICFDIMRTPLSHLMMYNAMFKTSYLASLAPDDYTVRPREGCSHAGEA